MHRLVLTLVVVGSLLAPPMVAAEQYDESASRYRSEANPTEPLRTLPERYERDPFDEHQSATTPPATTEPPHDPRYAEEPPAVGLPAEPSIESPPAPRASLPALEPADEQVEHASFAEPPATEDRLELTVPRTLDRTPFAREASRGSTPAPEPAISTALTVGGSLALVLGLFFLVAWLLRRGMSKGSGLLPAEAVEVLGRTALPHRQHMQLIRCGNKLLLVAVSAGGAETLTEITDPLEVERLVGLCTSARSNSHAAAFRQVLDQFGREPHAPGFVDTRDGATTAVRSPSRLPGGGTA